MKDTIYLAEQAKIVGGCQNGLSQLNKAKTEQDLVNCYFSNIDFCLAKNFPGNEYLKRSGNTLISEMVFVDCQRMFKNPEKLVLLGKCDCNVELTDYSVSRIYVKHDSKLIIKASGNAFVVVDALDNSNVQVERTENARVTVNTYSKAICTGATKIIAKNAETYDLHPI